MPKGGPGAVGFYSAGVMDSGDSEVRVERPFAADTASFYARYRREYPDELLARVLQLTGAARGRLLDLGCGTGQLILRLAGHFEHAVGIDPEPDMLRHAESAARQRGVNNVEWMTGSTEELRQLQPTLGRFDLVTIGTEFHFMQPIATLSDLQRIAPHGVVVVAYTGSPMWLHPDPWAKALRSVLQRRLGPLDEADFTTEALNAAEAAMHDLGYTEIERWERSYVETIDSDFVVGHILSATSTDQIPPAHRPQFAREVHSAIASVAPSENISETVSARAIIARA
jgi:ubiquinone/menaquinone biosynthesis C-methylase UbiE